MIVTNLTVFLTAEVQLLGVKTMMKPQEMKIIPASFIPTNCSPCSRISSPDKDDTVQTKYKWYVVPTRRCWNGCYQSKYDKVLISDEDAEVGKNV